MYKSFFGLHKQPFSISPDPSFLYMSERHREALAHILYGIKIDSGFVLLTGEVGTGKTTICRCLLEQMPESAEVAYIINPQLSVNEFLASMCDEFGIKYPEETSSNKVFIDLLNKYLLAAHAQSKKPVLIIDEAQNLSARVLEQIRLLTNLETNDRKLLLVIMIGQPELRDKLSTSGLRQLQQRITVRYHLKALNRKEISSYLRHRLAVAGFHRSLFSNAAIGKLFNLTNGVPRLINIVADRAMLAAYTKGKSTIGRHILSEAAREYYGEARKRRGVFAPIVGWAFCALIFAAGLSFILNKYYNNKFINVLQNQHLAVFNQPTLNANNPTPPIVTIIEDSHQEHHITTTPLPVEPQNSGEELTPPQPVLSQIIWPTELPLANSKRIAFQTLFEQWGYTYNPQEYATACQQADSLGLNCLYRWGNLGTLRKLNRPAVLQMISRQGQEFYVTLAGLQKHTATISVAGKDREVSTDIIEELWSGSYTMLWQMPPDYQRAVSPDSTVPWLTWLKQQFYEDQVVNQEPTANLALNGELLEQVKEFQAANGFKADGIVGPQTIICLNTLTDTEVPTLNNP